MIQNDMAWLVADAAKEIQDTDTATGVYLGYLAGRIYLRELALDKLHEMRERDGGPALVDDVLINISNDKREDMSWDGVAAAVRRRPMAPTRDS